MTFRIIKHGSYDAATNMAIDESIYKSVKKGTSPATIRFYSFRPDSVSIGANQSTNIVNLDFSRQYGIGYVRRPSGGNAVFHHEKDITYSIIANTNLFSGDIREIYKTICGWIVNSLNEAGLHAEFYGQNDILVDKKKVCGNALMIYDDVFLQHGSVFVHSDKNYWINCLNIEKEKLENVSCISEISGKNNIENDLLQLLEKHFTANPIVGNNFQYGALTEEELRNVDYFLEKKYKNNAFLLDPKREKTGDACIIDIRDD